LSSESHKSNLDNLHRSLASVLIHIWLAGLLFGTVLSIFSRDYLSTMLSVIYPLFFSVPQRFLLTLLPFLLSAVAVSFSHPRWLFYLCGIKAVWFATGCYLMCLSYGSAGWLARWLFMFCDVSSLPLLFFYWLRLLCVPRKKRIYEQILFFAPLVTLIIIDYRIVTPYAAKFGFI